MAVLGIVILDQAARVALLRSGNLLGVRIAPFDPPLFSPVQVESVARLRREVAEGTPADGTIAFDAELGWDNRPESGSGGERIDALGARVGSRVHGRQRREGTRRILVFGCSFTFGTEVAGDEAWPDRLEAALGEDVEVINLGVPGYGLDQAFLRWRRLGPTLRADEVWLGFMPAAAARNVNLYRPALRPWSPTVAFKPRFELDAQGALLAVPQPCRSLTELLALVDDPDRFVAAVAPHDAFVARWPSAWARQGSFVWHWSATSRLFVTLLCTRNRDPHVLLADPTGEVAKVTAAIGEQMAREVHASGAAFRILLLPDRDGLRALRAGGHASWQRLVERWRGAGIRVDDPGDALDPGDAAAWSEGGHYSAAGNAAVARALSSTLRR